MKAGYSEIPSRPPRILLRASTRSGFTPRQDSIFVVERIKLGRFWNQLKEEEEDDDDDRKVGLAMASLPSTTLPPTTAFSSARAPSLAPRAAASLPLPSDKLPGCPSPSSPSPRALTVVGSPAPGLRSRTRGTFRCFASGMGRGRSPFFRFSSR